MEKSYGNAMLKIKPSLTILMTLAADCQLTSEKHITTN